MQGKSWFPGTLTKSFAKRRLAKKFTSHLKSVASCDAFSGWTQGNAAVRSASTCSVSGSVIVGGFPALCGAWRLCTAGEDDGDIARAAI